MNILLVTDQYYAENNGATVSARRFAKVLTRRGHCVRVVSTGSPSALADPDDAYLMKKQYIILFDKLITSQGMVFAKPDDDVLRNAIRWADIVHFLVPFALSHHGVMIARELGKPYTAAFHVQPENVTSSIHLSRVEPANTGIYHWFNHYFYKYCGHIHCPSDMIANMLRKNGYEQQLHVISNGIDPDFVYRKIQKPDEYKNKFVILSTGRLSVEKRQDVLIRAVQKSSHADNIQLILAGNGPKKKKLERLGHSLPNEPHVQFYSKSGLLDTIAMSDLYVHSADVEIEAMSCMEAFAGGLVPVIAVSPKSATSQFALDARSLFRAGDSSDLARKIDYWIEHENDRREMERAYSASANKYNLDSCVHKAEDMFCEAIEECRRKA